MFKWKNAGNTLRANAFGMLQAFSSSIIVYLFYIIGGYKHDITRQKFILYTYIYDFNRTIYFPTWCLYHKLPLPTVTE